MWRVLCGSAPAAVSRIVLRSQIGVPLPGAGTRFTKECITIQKHAESRRSGIGTSRNPSSGATSSGQVQHTQARTPRVVTAPLAAHTLWCAAQRGSNITTVSAMPAPEPAPHGPLCTPFPQNTTRRPPVGHPSRDVAKTGVAHILPKSLPKKPSGLVPYFLRPPNLDTMISTSSGTRSS